MVPSIPAENKQPEGRATIIVKHDSDKEAQDSSHVNAALIGSDKSFTYERNTQSSVYRPNVPNATRHLDPKSELRNRFPTIMAPHTPVNRFVDNLITEEAAKLLNDPRKLACFASTEDFVRNLKSKGSGHGKDIAHFLSHFIDQEKDRMHTGELSEDVKDGSSEDEPEERTLWLE